MNAAPPRAARRPRADRRPGARRPRRPGSTGRASPRPPRARRARCARAHARLPIDLDDPAVWVAPRGPPARARAPARPRRRTPPTQLSRWALAHPDALRRRRPALLADRLADAGWPSPTSNSPPVGARRAAGRRVPRRRAPGGGWELTPTLLAGRDPRCSPRSAPRIERDLRARHAARRRDRRALLERWNPRTLHAGPRENLDSARPARRGAHARARPPRQPGRARATRSTAGAACSSAAAATRTGDGRERAELALRVVTLPGAGAPAPPARLGAARRATTPPTARRWSSARPSRPRSSTGCRCCCPPRPPASSRTPSASGA